MTIKDSSGKVLANIKATKTFQNVVFSSADVSNGQSYTVSVDSNSTSVTAGQSTGGQGGPGGGAPGGQGGAPGGQGGNRQGGR